MLTSSLHPADEAGARTHCPYCALQCGMRVSASRAGVSIAGDGDFPVNRGALCVKGWTAAATLGHGERLTTPLVRNAHGALVAATWPEALARTAAAVQDVQRRFGRDAVGVFGSGALTNEKAYLLGKLARVALGTANIDYNGRFCMSSAAAAATRAFGVDRGLPFPLADLAQAQVVLLVGANVLETLPPIRQYLDAQRAAGGALIVVDPRTSPTAQAAALHLRLIPGSDTALANGLLHLLVRDGRIDERYIRDHTEGFAHLRGLVASYWPEWVERLTGVPEAQLGRAAALLGRAERVMILTGRGAEQQAHGVANTLAFINLALALGMVGRPHAGFGCLTGQGNGQGGREQGQKADQLPGARRLDDPAARAAVAAVWGIPAEELPGPGLSAYEMLDGLGQPGGVQALLVFGANLVVSAPHAQHVAARLRSLRLLAVADFFLSETAALAGVVFPVAQWAEEEGTMTNLEGRVIRRRRVLGPPAGVKTDLELLCGLAQALGRGAHFPSADARGVFDELRRASAGGAADYAGITYERIDREQGVFWPCPDEQHPGTPRLFAAGRFATPSGRARFHAVHHLPPAEVIDPEYPLYLTTGRQLGHYQTGSQTRRTPRLLALAPAAVVELHPAAARRHGVADGDAVRLTTRRGTAFMTARLTELIREDTVFVPFHFAGLGSVNRLTNPALDPTSRMPEFKVCAVRLERVTATKDVA